MTLAKDGRRLVSIRINKASREEPNRDRIFDGIGVSVVIPEDRPSQAAPKWHSGAFPAETPLPDRIVGDEVDTTRSF